MGYTAPDSLHLIYDSAQMESEVLIDTLAPLEYSKRIEFQQLTTQKRLQQADVKYQKWAYIPNGDRWRRIWSQLSEQPFQPLVQR